MGQDNNLAVNPNLKIYLVGPQAAYYVQQLAQFNLRNIEFGLPPDESSGPMLVITEPRAWWIAWHYFLSFREIFPDAILRLGCWQLNHGQPLADLAWPSLDLKALEVLPPHYRDGVALTGIYYFPANPALTWGQREHLPCKIIPTPLRWPKSTIQEEADVAADLKKYAPHPSAETGTFARPLLLLDRDGVINVDGHYPARPSDIKLRPQIFPLLHYAQEKNIPRLVLSNQSGVARGKFTPADLQNVTQYLQEVLAQEGLKIDGWYDCPFYPSATDSSPAVAAYQTASFLRKPLPGMALQAAADWDGDLVRSVMIGDKLSDALYFNGQNFWLPTSAEYVVQEPDPRPYGFPQIFTQESELLQALRKIWP